MLPADLQTGWANKAREAIRLLAVQPAFILRQAAPGAPVAVEVALKTVGPTDQDIVNTWGLGARIFTLPSDGLAGAAPVRFDRVQIGESIHTVDYVHEIRLGDEVVAWKLYARGLMP